MSTRETRDPHGSSGAHEPDETGGSPGTAEPRPSGPAPLRLGFARGIAPSRWAKRWAAASPGHPLELVPIDVAFGPAPDHGVAAQAAPLDVMLERAMPRERPAESRHAVHLYTESLALVVAVDHELAEHDSVDLGDLELVPLLDHSDHAPGWPDPEPWADPSWAPTDAVAALRLVATGLGGILLPLPLARHLANKREHAVLPVTDDDRLPGSSVWATWARDRDAADVQQLAGVLRGRTARSSRPGADAGPGSGSRSDRSPREDARKTADRSRQQAGDTRASGASSAKKPKLKPNSRGAQLAAAKAKAERRKAEARKAKKKRR
ncbi:LysR family transcriptional regulator [Leucobacter sp. CSA1]|uniref:LysR family transcriptional regulator n=1 Tax=Leucobacter chromiisoli TaxID=2796471 RepID=A0A934Q977_9MICO|nr:LysR substrate-binding domain-containing protein [Leucobacter chromiisoli]MBK0420083.1 LysR family transcriptional regulator [Leucobacter chromiisoli]